MKKTILLLVLASALFSFSDKKPLEMKFDLKALERSLAVIPQGTFDMGVSPDARDEKATGHIEPKPNKPVTVDQFYISKYEVSNGQYLAFLSELRKTDTLQYHKMLPDTLVWRQKFSYNEPYVEYYLRHPAYRDYPVVGVTHEQAAYFCDWLTQKYNKEPGSKFKNAHFYLPTVEQWVFAAQGGLYKASFPWGDDFDIQDEKGKWRANFLALAQGGIRRDSENAESRAYGSNGKKYCTDAGSADWNQNDVTAPVTSYAPNGYGLYNMAGNVEEYVRANGITKGGSWMDTGYYLQNFVSETYDSQAQPTSSDRGFRVVMEIAK